MQSDGVGSMEGYRKRAALFLTSQSITLFGSSLVQFAIIWYVTLKTSSGLWVSAMTVAAYAPQFIISFFAGVWADRYSKKRLILLSDGLIALSTLLLAAFLPRIGEGASLLAALVAISAVRSLGAGVQTPAVGAVIPQIVPTEKLMRYNGVNATIQSLVQFAAPAAAGAILSFGTLQETMLIDVATAAVGMGLLTTVAIPFTKAEGAPALIAEMQAGFRYAVRERFVGALLAAFGAFIFLCVPAGFLATLFVSRYFGDTYWYLTLVEVTGFIGMSAGGLLLSVWGGFRNRILTLVLGMAAFGALAIGMGAASGIVPYLILMALYGVALTVTQTTYTTLLQEHTALEMQGRMFGLFGAMYAGFLPIGMAVFGPLADVISMRLLMVLSGVLLLALSVAVFCSKRLSLHSADADPTDMEPKEKYTP